MVMKSRYYNHHSREVYLAAIKAIDVLGYKLEYENEDLGKIKVKVGGSLFSWGEFLKIGIQIVDDGCKINVESEASGQLFDWGKAENNILKFFDALESYL